MGSLTQSKLPVIDLSKENLKPGSSCWLSTSKNVLHALENCGSFVAVYNKVSPELHDTILSASKELYDLPMETKVKNTSDLLGFGYGGGFTTMPLFEYFGIENGATLEGTQKFTDLMWPEGNETFCESALLVSKLLAELTNVVLQMVFGSYDLEKYYDSHIEAIQYLLRFIKYRAPMNCKNNTGLHPHADKGFLTILDQNEVKGLEIQTKNGDWISFEPSPSAFVVLAGDGLMAWSNGRIHSPFHQVTMSGNEDKYTIGLFSFASGMVETPEELVDDEHPLQFRAFSHYGYLQYCGGEGMKHKNPIKAYCGV